MNTMPAHQIASLIRNGDWSNDDLNTMAEAIRYRRAQVTKEVRRSLTPGATVKFHNSRRGGVTVGVVTKIATKFVTVNAGTQGLWRVPANMLETV